MQQHHVCQARLSADSLSVAKEKHRSFVANGNEAVVL